MSAVETDVTKPVVPKELAETLDQLSDGRMILGIGSSGPQVAEGWHGQRFAHQIQRTREYVAVVRQALSREIDLDLLLYGDAVIDEPGLRVPHPHLHERAFMLVPMLEVDPKVSIPAIGSARDALAALASGPAAAAKARPPVISTSRGPRPVVQCPSTWPFAGSSRA